jgi:carboxylesterase type B
MFSEGILSCPTYNGMFRISEQQNNVYFYRFDYTGFRFGGFLGALHAMEIPYVFNSMDRKPVSLLYGKKQMPAAQELSKVIQGYWINFAHTGNPNGQDLPEWPEFLLSGPLNVQVFGEQTRTETVGMAERCAFWEEYNRTHAPLFETMGKPKK